LASSLVGYMGFYELRAAMEPPPLVMIPSKVVGGEEASTVHPWDMWNFGSFVTKDRARELHGQNSEFAHLRINLEEQVEKMFLEEHTTLLYGGVGGGGAFFTRYPIATKSGKGCSKGV
jgi:hypothetical protein